ncbi:MAG: hypothetical protein SGCHY_004025 [Lobulomycetales sp.]
MFISSTALLPSSLAMNCVALALALAVSPPSRGNTFGLIFVIGIGSLVGWPFMAVLLIPLFLNDVLLSVRGIKSLLDRLLRWASYGLLCIALIGAPIAILDYLFYRKMEFVPLNIVWYNVFNSGGQGGPDIFGTEPWNYYLKNLFLNFNLVFILAIATVPILLLSLIHSRLWGSLDKHTLHLSYFARCSAFYLWLAIFTLQPHKEERFMFVVYPLICFNAAVSLHLLRNMTLSWTSIPAWPTYFLLGVFASLSISRSMALYTNYSAPMVVYSHFAAQFSSSSGPGIADGSSRLCIGKEWHRFPSHFFVPDNVTVSFIKSEFDGILPKLFPPDAGSWRSGTWSVPSGMNDVNREEVDRYVALEQCDFLIDSDFSHGAIDDRDPGGLEPVYRRDTGVWEEVESVSFLNAAATPFWARVLYLPFLGRHRVWGDFTLLKRI